MQKVVFIISRYLRILYLYIHLLITDSYSVTPGHFCFPMKTERGCEQSRSIVLYFETRSHCYPSAPIPCPGGVLDLTALRLIPPDKF